MIGRTCLDAERAVTVPAEAASAQWRHAMCDAASRANCGICWAVPLSACTTNTALTGPAAGYHVGRFVRAHRRGLISAEELSTLTAGLLPAALIWDLENCDGNSNTREGDTGVTGTNDEKDHRDTARETRRQELARMTKNTLCRMYRAGVTTPDGTKSQWIGGMYPPEQWTKQEVISSILDISHPLSPAASEADQ